MAIESPFLITGAKGGNTNGADAPNRLEISDFVKNDKFFSLFVQALAAMSAEDEDELLSFFQIGGIHGAPKKPWNGSGTKDLSKSWDGYCTHGTVLFPTWHRPYMAVYEQIIQKHAKQIAETYTHDTGSWKQAAANLRSPYWDWASKATPPDEVVALDHVTITKPDGSKAAVANPLLRYAFQRAVPADFPKEFRHRKTTVRYPLASDPVKALKERLNSTFPATKDNTYRMLTQLRDWPSFSNHTQNPRNSTTANSLESIHDGIHVYAGGEMGHMAYPIVASFDPIFFLHHTNVDRMLSLWSALNPDVWVTEGSSEGGTWTIPEDQTIGPDTDLTPFWNANTTYWASTAVTSTAALGYTYPEFNDLDMGNKAAVRQAIADKVTQLYGGDSGAAALSSSAPPPILATPEGGATSIADWSVRVRVKKYELPASFSVVIFLGTVPSDPGDWFASPAYVGDHSVFVNSAVDACGNCRVQNAAGVVTEGFVHLNQWIAAHSGLASLGEHDVVPYLQKNLHWRVRTVNGDVHDLTDETSLEVAVFSVKLGMQPFARNVTQGEPRYFNAITAGRLGGVQAQ